MLKRISLDIFVNESDYAALVPAINILKSKAKDLKRENSSIIIHDCGHDETKPCTNMKVLL